MSGAEFVLTPYGIGVAAGVVAWLIRRAVGS